MTDEFRRRSASFGLSEQVAIKDRSRPTPRKRTRAAVAALGDAMRMAGDDDTSETDIQGLPVIGLLRCNHFMMSGSSYKLGYVRLAMFRSLIMAFCLSGLDGLF